MECLPQLFLTNVIHVDLMIIGAKNKKGDCQYLVDIRDNRGEDKGNITDTEFFFF